MRSQATHLPRTWRYNAVPVALFVISVCLLAALDESLANQVEKQQRFLKIGEIPNLQLPARPPLTGDRKAEILRSIEQLAEIDRPGFGYSWQLTGRVFAPQPANAQAGNFKHTDADLTASPVVLSLVEAGPDAIPFLLDKLDDDTPTKFTIQQTSGMSAIWHNVEMLTNPANEKEIKPSTRTGIARWPGLQQYTVTRGDVCFAILGQITGRGYQAVRSGVRGDKVINSPVASKELLGATRANWRSKDPRSKLFRSLLTDYATDGIYDENDARGLHRASYFKVEAARRLAYYFADESSELLVRRISTLDLARASKATDPVIKREAASVKRSMQNGVRTGEFLKALTCAKSPKVQQALLEAARRTDDPQLFLALLPATIQVDRAFTTTKLRGFIAALPEVEELYFSDGFALLVALVQVGGESARQEIESYLKGGSVQRRWTVCTVFERVRTEWAVDVLLPFLDDRSVAGSDRICDAAARAVVSQRQGLSFDISESVVERDKRIAEIKAELTSQKARSADE